MEFTIQTTFDQKAMTAVARTLRKTIRKKRSRRSRILGTLVALLGILLLFTQESFGLKSVVTLLAVAVILTAPLWEDSVNGYFARKRGLPGLDLATVTFHEAGYHSETDLGASDFYYDSILGIIQTGDYFVFLFSINHAQVYDMRTLTGGSVQDFSEFLMEKTGKVIEKI